MWFKQQLQERYYLVTALGESTIQESDNPQRTPTCVRLDLIQPAGQTSLEKSVHEICNKVVKLGSVTSPWFLCFGKLKYN